MSLADTRRRIKAVTDHVNKGAKYKLLVDPDEAPNPYFLRRPCGVTQLDIDTGGGLPAGGLCYLSGPNNAGKTWLLYNYFAMHQRIYGEEASIVYGSVENPPNHQRMREVGCLVAFPEVMLNQMDADRAAQRLPKLTKMERAEYRRQVGTFKVLRANTSEELLDSILKIYASNAFHIIAVDSVSALQASAEAELDTLAENPQQAANASLLTRFMQRYAPLTQGLTDGLVTSTVIFTSQVRANRHKTEVPSYIGKWLKDWTVSGGANAMKHGKLIDIQLWSDSAIKTGPKGKQEIVGKTIKWDLIKGSAGTHDNICGEYDYHYDCPGDHTPSLISTGIEHGVVVEKEGLLTFLDHNTKNPLPSYLGAELKDVAGLQGLRNILREDPQTEFIIRREILSAAGVDTCLYRLP
jgi:RecA/RadA recombinase